jgi:hypothetical protein
MASGPFHFLVFQVAHSSKVSEFGFCTSWENGCIYSRRFHCQSNPRTRFNRFFIHGSVHLTPGLRSDPRVIGTGGRLVRYWFPNVMTRGAIQHFTAGLVFSGGVDARSGCQPPLRRHCDKLCLGRWVHVGIRQVDGPP